MRENESRPTLAARRLARTDGPLWESAPAGELTTDFARARQAQAALSGETATAFLEVLTSSSGLAPQLENDRKELALRMMIQSLSPADAYCLRVRLDTARSNDPIIVAFMRFTPERRSRIRSLLTLAQRPKRA